MIIAKPENSQCSQLRTLWQEAFLDTQFFIDAFFQTAFSGERCRCAVEDDRVVAALYWFTCSCKGRNLAYLYAVATAKEYRGMGICHRLMEDTHAHLKAIGYDAVVLVPGSESLFRFYEHMGYRICSKIGEICCNASDEKIPLEIIDRYEYEHLRRKFLPENGVLQESENLDLLERVENFYKGEEFVLMGHREEEMFVGVELLGDPTIASKILKQLDCENGTFRMPGEDKPFAMIYSLSDDFDMSDLYFGIAFDL